MLHQQLALLGSLGHHGTVAQSHGPQTVTCLVGQRSLQPLQDRHQPEDDINNPYNTRTNTECSAGGKLREREKGEKIITNETDRHRVRL